MTWSIAGSMLLCVLSLSARAGEWSGYLAGEFRLFDDSPRDPRQDNYDVSFSAQPEYYHSWDDGRQSFTFVPFLRWDEDDSHRSHWDIRELTWVLAADAWELRAGIRKLFWGVTESVHLVDIINQTDLVENIDGEDKLGQAMLNLALIQDWGTLDFYLLPGFRERTFPGVGGRLRSHPAVDVDHPRYESSREQRRIDWALRWSHSLGDWDLGLSHFHGTSRTPRLLPTLLPARGLVLQPYYDIIDQTGLDVQATKGDWLWKLETIHRRDRNESYTALAAGFEYTLFAVFGSDADLGLISEYLYDNRDEQASTPFEDDLFVGARLAMNDIQSTELLAGVIADLDSNARFYSLEASRRLGDRWKISLEARILSHIGADDPLFPLQQDDYLQAELAWYF